MSNETKIIAGIGLITILLVIGGAILFGNTAGTQKASEKITVDQQKLLIAHASEVKGAKDAKVTIVEFSDFQCPACGTLNPIVEKIRTDYKDTVRFVFRHYPLPMHKNSKIAAYAAEAAGEQGKFFEMVNELFSNQKEWSESTEPLTYFGKYAQKLHLNEEQFKQDVTSKKYEKKIQQDITDGDKLGIEATPTFFINNEKITGGLPYEEFKKRIDTTLQ
jgi:protein-disulfide isomerase